MIGDDVCCWYRVQIDRCCHQSRDIPTRGFPKLPPDGEKHNPGAPGLFLEVAFVGLK